jgi:uncharacterized membrane protein
MNASLWLFAHLICTLLMVGLIWFVQIVHYPLMANVAASEFRRYAQMHQARTTLVVAGPMLLEAATAAYLLLAAPELRTSSAFLIASLLLVVVWASTAWWQVPIHSALASGYDDRHIRRLVRSNWLRTLAWSCRAVLVARVFMSGTPGLT